MDTFIDIKWIKQAHRGAGFPVGPGSSPQLLGVAFGAAALYAAGRWLFSRQDAGDLVASYQQFEADEQLHEQQDGGMKGEDIYYERTDAVVEPVEVDRVDDDGGEAQDQTPPLDMKPTQFTCVRCKHNMGAVNWSELSCSRCGYGPVVVRTCRRQRYCRGHFNLLRDVIKEFPQRFDHPNRRLAEQQVYTYMLRRSKELRWTAKDQELLPALAAMAFVVRTKGERDASKLGVSEYADSCRYEYKVDGSYYPNIRRIWDALRVYIA